MSNSSGHSSNRKFTVLARKSDDLRLSDDGLNQRGHVTLPPRRRSPLRDRRFLGPLLGRSVSILIIFPSVPPMGQWFFPRSFLIFRPPVSLLTLSFIPLTLIIRRLRPLTFRPVFRLPCRPTTRKALTSWAARRLVF